MRAYSDVVTLRQRVDAALAAVTLTDADQGTAELARTYADQIDGMGDLAKLGPPLLAALESLGLSPRARAAMKGGKPDVPRSGKLDELRERRNRKSNPEDLDSTAP
jgi:hypothetical protein